MSFFGMEIITDMKYIHTCLLGLLISILLTECVSVPMPQIAIPQQRNALNASFWLGNNGLGLNAGYSPDAHWVLDVGANYKTSPLAPKSISVEAGGSWVAPGKKLMLSASYGGGSFLLKPNLSGSDYSLNNISGKINKISLGVNAPMNKRLGLAIRISHRWVSAFAEYNRPEYNYSDNYQVNLGLEGILYFYLTARKDVLLCIGGGRAVITDTGRNRLAEEGMFYPFPLFVAAGYIFKTKE